MTRLSFARVVCVSAATAFATGAFAAPVYIPTETNGPVVRTATDEDHVLLPRHHDRLEFRAQQSHPGGGGNSK
jgi:hypothetical protein